MPQSFFRMRRVPESGYPVIDANSSTKEPADAVTIDGSGFLALAGTTAAILGFSNAFVTPASDNQTVAKAKSLYIPAPGVLMRYGTDIALAQTDIGTYTQFDVVTTGAFRVETIRTDGSTLLILGGDNPDTLSTNVIVSVSEPQTLAFALVT